MATVYFNVGPKSIEVDEGIKLLVAARKAQVEIRFGCASCRCGTCAVKVNVQNGKLSPMKAEEKDLLAKMLLPLDGSVRLACQARALAGDIYVDLNFQSQYDPGQGGFDERPD